MKWRHFLVTSTVYAVTSLTLMYTDYCVHYLRKVCVLILIAVRNYVDNNPEYWYLFIESILVSLGVIFVKYIFSMFDTFSFTFTRCHRRESPAAETSLRLDKKERLHLSPSVGEIYFRFCCPTKVKCIG